MRPIYQIYIEEQLIDLDPKTVIATTFQTSDIASGDISSRKISFTNQIKVPATATNIRIFEYANNPKSGSTFPYLKKTVRILSNGIKIMDSVVIIKSFDTYFNLQLFESPKDLSFQIANLFLSDLDFGDVAITWNQSFMDGVRNATTGWCAPVINYGQISDALLTVDSSIGDYNLPSVAYKDILTAILSNAGYTVSGDFYDNDATFNNMAMTYGRNEWLGPTLNFADVMPTDILQSDFLKDFFIRFGSYFKFSNSNIEIVILEDILKNTSGSIDWTNKRVKNKKDIIQYTWSNWSQENNFTYNPIDNGRSVFSFQPIVDGSLTVSNEILPASSDVYNSIFAQPNNVVQVELPEEFLHKISVHNTSVPGIIYGATYCIYKTVPTSFTFDNMPKPMLVVLNANDSDPSIKYNGTSRSGYMIGRFADYYNTYSSLPSPPNELSWRGAYSTPAPDGLLDIYYASVQRILTAGTITTTHEYNLTDMDINSLDLLIPIYDDGNYYLINKVNNYVSGKTTRVELLKI